MTEIWFDDGLLSVYEDMYPLMEKYGLVGIIGVVTSCVGKTFRWQKKWELPCMNIDQIKHLMNEGWKIASHTVTHRDLTKISKSEAEWEIIESKLWIITNLGVEPIALIPPWNRITPELKKYALNYYPRVVNKKRIYFHTVNLPHPSRFNIKVFEERIRRLAK